MVAPMLLAACGGGGGGGGATPLSSLVTIDSQNAPTIAAAVLGTALDTEGLAGLGGLGLVPVAANAKTTSLAMSKLGTLQQQQTQLLKQRAQLGLLQAPIPEETVPCAAGGTMTLSGNIANGGQLSAGDTLDFAFADCDQGDGAVINGVFAMSITSFSGDLSSGMILLGIEVTVTGFEVADASGTATMNGSIAMSMDLRDPVVTAITISTASLSVSDGSTSHTLSDFSIVQTVDSSASVAYSLDVSGSLSSSRFDGRVDFETTATLQNDGGQYAFAGEVVISGANGATITVFVLSNQMVQLEIDLDGDGNADETVTRTWAELS
jgi:hypothetical protein